MPTSIAHDDRGPLPGFAADGTRVTGLDGRAMQGRTVSNPLSGRAVAGRPLRTPRRSTGPLHNRFACPSVSVPFRGGYGIGPSTAMADEFIWAR